jgi:GNAT superfamily N-acetyltransferase
VGRADDIFWAEFLRVTPEDWDTPGLSVRLHAGLADFRGIWSFRRKGRTVVSAPAGWVTPLSALVARPQAPLLEESEWRAILGDDFDLAIGPAFQGCLDPARFRKTHDANTRFVEASDAAFSEFRAECDPAEWELAGLDEKVEGPIAACFAGSRITAAAGYRSWSPTAGDPCVLTHPEFRGRGLGSAVVSAVVERALAQGKVLLYQTLESNLGAVGVARKVGYEQYATHLAVRLKRDAKEG